MLAFAATRSIECYCVEIFVKRIVLLEIKAFLPYHLCRTFADINNTNTHSEIAEESDASHARVVLERDSLSDDPVSADVDITEAQSEQPLEESTSDAFE
jgi:hypothetical protein